MERESQQTTAAQKSWVARLCAGVLIGAAGIAPGVSGGVIAVGLGLYQPMLAALAGIFRRGQGRRNAAFLAPLVGGIGLGLMLTGYMLMAFMEKFAAEALYLFAGLVLGSLPSLVRRSGGWRLKKLPPLIAGAAAFLLPARLLPAAVEAAALDVPGALGCGAVLAAGTVVPGVSSSFLLIRCGFYRAYLAALAGMRTGEIALIGVGFAAVAAALVRAVNRIFARFAGTAYLVIAGFTFVSVMDALPPLGAALSPTVCVLALPLGAGLGLLLRGDETSP